GESPVLVVLTDGRANIARDGSPGRAQAAEDALAAARELRALGVPSLLIDTAPQPQTTAQALAEGLGGAYLPLPHADARAMSQAVRLATARR
ncbi:MAG: magnesium chelatase ATPase subunit D, partial [Burkholderiaceae bacterium]